MLGRWLVSALVGATLVSATPVGAQVPRPLYPLSPNGLRVAPFFDGWYANPDGTTTFSFGYSNLNRTEVPEIALGPDNLIEPKEFHGRQPTSFPPVISDFGDGAGPRIDRRDRERGVFTVTVPAGFRGEVVWTLRYQGQIHRVPASTKTGAYQLSWPMAMGSVPPLLRFSPGGPSGRGPTGIQGDPLKVAVGTPLDLTVWINDDSVREVETLSIKPRGGAKAAMNVWWYKHSGPGPVAFSVRKQPIPETTGTAKASATFSMPGDYVIRARADNFGRLDTSPGNQCCWTNGYVKVTVTP